MTLKEEYPPSMLFWRSLFTQSKMKLSTHSLLKVITVTTMKLNTTAPNYFCFLFTPFFFFWFFIYAFRYIYLKLSLFLSEALLNDYYWGNLSLILSLASLSRYRRLTCSILYVLDVLSVYLGNDIPETWGLVLKGEVSFRNHILVISAIRRDVKEFTT